MLSDRFIFERTESIVARYIFCSETNDGFLLGDISNMPDIRMNSLPNRVLPIIYIIDVSGA